MGVRIKSDVRNAVRPAFEHLTSRRPEPVVCGQRTRQSCGASAHLSRTRHCSACWRLKHAITSVSARVHLVRRAEEMSKAKSNRLSRRTGAYLVHCGIVSTDNSWLWSQEFLNALRDAYSKPRAAATTPVRPKSVTRTIGVLSCGGQEVTVQRRSWINARAPSTETCPQRVRIAGDPTPRAVRSDAAPNSAGAPHYVVPGEIAAVGWRYDEAKRTLMNRVTGEHLCAAAPLGFSIRGNYFILYNLSRPRLLYRPAVQAS